MNLPDCRLRHRIDAESRVVDDASTGNTKQEAQRFIKHGVRYLRVEHRNSQQARRAGLEATRSDRETGP